MNKIKWINFYRELAYKIRDFSSKEVFKLILEVEAKTKVNSLLGKYKNEITKIDHFSFFANFNRGISLKNRILILEFLKEKLNIKSEIPSNFDGIPVLNNMNAWFSWEEEDIEFFISFFRLVIKNLNNIENYFNKALRKKGTAIGKLTCGLYWINPDSFLPLDTNTKKYLEFYNIKIDKNTQFEGYLRLLEKVKKEIGDNFVKISIDAFKFNKENKKKKELKENILQTQYWLYAPGENAKYWDEFYEKGIMAIGWDELGNLENYKTKDEIKEKLSEITGKRNPYNDTTANFEFLKEINIGDIIIPKKGIKDYLGYGIVESDYIYDETRETYKSIRKVKWIKKGNWEEENGDIVLKTLTNITKYPEYVEKLKKLIGIENNILNSSQNPMQNKTTKLFETKKQIILYGPPGTGKTYNIKNIIENHSKENYEKLKQDGKVEFITFHQSFSYEEFIEGIKPNLESDEGEIKYKIEDGIFKKMVEKAKINKKTNFEEAFNKLLEDLENIDGGILKLKTKTGKEFGISINSKGNLSLHTGKDLKKQGTLTKENIKKQAESNEKVFDFWESYFYAVISYLRKKYNYMDIKQQTKTKNYYLIIDEINRGNISKIFGELITLLEADKRNKNWKVKLPYSKKDFWIPENLFIVATMNTSDKSIVSLDTALRRRFGFVEMLPDYDLEDLQKEIEGIKLTNLIEKLNKRIEVLLDKDHLIGHSYLLKVKNLEDLKQVFYNEIIPLLEEYFYGEEEKIKLVLGSKFFEEKNIEKDLFENMQDFTDEEEILKIKNLDDEKFLEAIRNIVNIEKNNDEN